MTVFKLGRATITRVEEVYGPTYPATQIFPDLSAEILAEVTLLVEALRAQFRELGDLVAALAAKRDVTPGAHDAIVATGELASSRIVAAAFAEQGLPAVWIDARSVLVTDAEHMMALPDMDATCARMRERVVPATARGNGRTSTSSFACFSVMSDTRPLVASCWLASTWSAAFL